MWFKWLDDMASAWPMNSFIQLKDFAATPCNIDSGVAICRMQTGSRTQCDANPTYRSHIAAKVRKLKCVRSSPVPCPIPYPPFLSFTFSSLSFFLHSFHPFSVDHPGFLTRYIYAVGIFGIVVVRLSVVVCL